MANKLTDKQRRFADEYLIISDATQAAIRAGYLIRTAKRQGSRLLANTNIKNYIEWKQNEYSERTSVTIEWIINELIKVYEESTQANLALNSDCKHGKPIERVNAHAANRRIARKPHNQTPPPVNDSVWLNNQD